jgi:putative oxidoreductase
MNHVEPIRISSSAITNAGATEATATTVWTKVRARVVATTPDSAATVGRVALALLLFPHGAQHALGWFGGYGFAGTFGWMTGTLGFPAPMAALAIVVELLAPLALIVGLGSRLAAAGLFGLMLGAMKTHAGNGFFMNWFGAMPTGSEGFEYHLVVMALAAVVMIKGGGRWSVDGWLTRSFRPDGRAEA